jgi:hypothetical protein
MRVALSALAIAATGTVALGGGAAESGQVSSLRIDCRFAHRPSVTVDVRPGPRIVLSSNRRRVGAFVGPFAVNATTGAMLGSEPGALSVRVSGRGSRKPVASTLHQFRADRPVNQFAGGHGFTGLVYAYLPRGAELQYYCRAR